MVISALARRAGRTRRRLLAPVLSGIVLLAAPAGASAAQRYASPSGSGSACTQAAPCTFPEAANNALANDEVIVAPGDYGSEAMPIPGAIQVVQPGVNIHPPAGAARPRLFLAQGLLLGGAGVRVSDLELRAAQTLNLTPLRVATSSAAAERIIAVATSAASTSACIVAAGTLTDSVCWSMSSAPGAEVGGFGPWSATLRNVTTISTVGPGLQTGTVAGTAGTLTATNVIARGGPAATDVRAISGGATTVTLDHSNFARRDAQAGTSITDPATNANQTAAPLFANAVAGDFHQAPGSPTIDAGAAAPASALDLDGEPRALGAAPDIGADELFDRTPIVQTGTAGAIGASSATLNGLVDPRALLTTARFDYGTTASYGLQTPPLAVPAVLGNQPLVQTLSALAPLTQYHFRATATNAAGSDTGADQTFTTARPAATVPPPSTTRPGRCANQRRGTSRGETIRGTKLGDRLIGLGGNDRLLGLAGDDCLFGGTGNDRLEGGRGSDRLVGSTGNDVLRGASGADELTGGRGNDDLAGGGGTDKLFGGPGRDRISAADGRRETVSCGAGRDSATVDRKDKVKGCERVSRR